MGREKEKELLTEKRMADLSGEIFHVKSIKKVEIVASSISNQVRRIKVNDKSWKSKHIKYNEIEKYYSKSAEKFKHVETEKRKLNGMPAVKGTRIPISLIIACLKDEMTFTEICAEYKLSIEDIEEAMEYVIEILDAPYQGGLE